MSFPHPILDLELINSGMTVYFRKCLETISNVLFVIIYNQSKYQQDTSTFIHEGERLVLLSINIFFYKLLIFF